MEGTMRALVAISLLFAVPGCFTHPDKPGEPIDGAVPDAAVPIDAPALDAAAPVDAAHADAQLPDGGVADSGPDAAVLSVGGMIAAACPGSSCIASKVAAYWAPQWDAYSAKP